MRRLSVSLASVSTFASRTFTTIRLSRQFHRVLKAPACRRYGHYYYSHYWTCTRTPITPSQTTRAMSTTLPPPPTGVASPISDPAQSSDPGDKDLVIRQVTPEIITFSRPFTRGGMAIGGRGTAVKLPNNEIFLYVSTPHTPATAETIARFGGKVGWLVTPDGEHGIFFEEYVKAYPDAQKIGVKRFKDKLPNVQWTGLFGEGGENKQYGFEPHITLHNVSTHVNDELVAIHHDSGTLIQADMLFNLPPTEQYSRAGGLPVLAKLLGGGKTMSPGGFLHEKMVGALAKDKELLKRELAPIHAAKWDRIIPCHGEVIETGGRAAWDKIWAKYA
ncbi:hypothetical protein DB88DRAFT_499084 [Papiliotrema laurentii]|uniref:Uncharacterized protein n=1 Tax=Papiliotrema laurentii TaxID=5418 RepID=A0AAD9CTQ3_PAPLA|nr:hypothetical protein DB88DRAFT_499084 [Papiliotrema laurentii]